MVLKIIGALVWDVLPSQYLVHIIATIIILAVTHAFAQGRRNIHERDLHARFILITVSSALYFLWTRITETVVGRFHPSRVNFDAVSGPARRSHYCAITIPNRFIQSRHVGHSTSFHNKQ
jgi:hypothetical protein